MLTTREITRTVQDLLDILPPAIASSLPKLQITLTQYLTDPKGHRKPGAGDYQPLSAGIPRVRVAVDSLKGLKGEARRREMRRILSHEFMHWLHMDTTHRQAGIYRFAIRDHFVARTAADTLVTENGVSFLRDKWFDTYAGRVYEEETRSGVKWGLEVPTRHFELWETPEKIMLHSHADQADSAAFRETFSLVHAIFNTL